MPSDVDKWEESTVVKLRSVDSLAVCLGLSISVAQDDLTIAWSQSLTHQRESVSRSSMTVKYVSTSIKSCTVRGKQLAQQHLRMHRLSCTFLGTSKGTYTRYAQCNLVTHFYRSRDVEVFSSSIARTHL